MGTLAALVVSTLPVAREMLAATPAEALQHPAPDATLQAFADTILPGRRATVTDLGNPILPGAITGVDTTPGAVEADALALFRSPFIGFTVIEPVFLADLESRAVRAGVRPFLLLGFDDRTTAVRLGLASKKTRLLYETAAAVVFSAFCQAGGNPGQTASTASGYRVMGFPGAAPAGYRDAGLSYGRKLARERTRKGYLP